MGRASFFLFPLFFLIFSCTAASRSIPTPNTRMVEKVPFYPQAEYQCGPASLAGVLNFWGLKVSPEQIASEVFSRHARGTLDMDMVFYAQRMGLEAIQYSGNEEDLKKNIDSGHPLILLVDEGLWVYQKNHFLVVVGYDDKGVIVNSGKDQHRWVSRDYFLKSWQKTRFWTLRITPK